jgi:chromosomal replication initiation ATPase DnaA
MWPVKATILTGPRRSGRTLLARAFVTRVGGRLIERAEEHDEEALFHAWNAAQESKRPLVMIADEVPPAWAIALPDLRTRIAVTPIARIAQPDDGLFKALLRLLFADRGLHIADEPLRFIADRVERSYYNAERVVEAIDRFAIADRARLTLPTIRRALAEGGLIDIGRSA